MKVLCSLFADLLLSVHWEHAASSHATFFKTFPINRSAGVALNLFSLSICDGTIPVSVQYVEHDAHANYEWETEVQSNVTVSMIYKRFNALVIT